MGTAEISFSRTEQSSLKHPMTLVGVGWDTYEAISEELGESNPFHVTFDKGTLTIMPITELHELLISLLDKFITFAGMYLRINVVPTGGATMRSKLKLIGVEPDLSYFVSKAAIHRVKDYVADELEMPPDIVVEIDVHHRSDDKFDIYSSLGVSEFWQYNGDVLRMFKLNESAHYEEVSESRQLPILTSEVLTIFINRGRNEEEQFIVLTDFQDWLKNAK